MNAGRSDNLADRAQDVQLRIGVAAVFLGLGGAVVVQRSGMSGWASMALLPLFLFGSYGLFAGLAKTCAFTALRGCRITELGVEPIADRHELAAVRKRGVRVVLASVVVSVLAIGLLAWHF